MADLKIHCVIFSLLLLNFVHSRTFQLESFCASRCNRGRGGNLCRCNGFHFAGKRTGHSYQPPKNSNEFSVWGIEITDDADDSYKTSQDLDNTDDDFNKPADSSTRIKRFQSILEKLFARRLLEERSRLQGQGRLQTFQE